MDWLSIPGLLLALVMSGPDTGGAGPGVEAARDAVDVGFARFHLNRHIQFVRADSGLSRMLIELPRQNARMLPPRKHPESTARFGWRAIERCAFCEGVH